MGHLISKNERQAWSSGKAPHSILGSKLYMFSYRNFDACIKSAFPVPQNIYTYEA